MTSGLAQAGFVADEDFAGAEWVSVGAVGWRLDDPSVGTRFGRFSTMQRDASPGVVGPFGGLLFDEEDGLTT
jgi:hypothetical protein